MAGTGLMGLLGRMGVLGITKAGKENVEMLLGVAALRSSLSFAKFMRLGRQCVERKYMLASMFPWNILGLARRGCGQCTPCVVVPAEMHELFVLPLKADLDRQSTGVYMSTTGSDVV